MKRIDYLILYVSDLGRSTAFYRDIVGLPFKLEGDGYVEFATEGTRFGLFARSKLTELIGLEGTEGGTSLEIALIVDDVDAEAARLEGRGVRLLSGPVDRPWGHRTIHFTDPDGNVVELAEEIERPG